jgi:hypothetical protein
MPSTTIGNKMPWCKSIIIYINTLLLSYFYILIVIISFICSLVSFRLLYPFHLKLFSILLFITVVTELISNFFLTPLHLNSNYPVYNIFTLIEYPLLGLFFRIIITNKNFKILCLAFIIIFPIFWFYIFLFVYKLDEWNSYGIIFGDLFIITFAARYLYELFTSNELIQFGKHTEFWISVALIFYCCCELPITGILNFWINDSKTTLRLLNILQLLNIAMYSIFIYAFLCPLKATRKKL